VRVNALRNRWFALRHGWSEANALGIIVSLPERGVPGFGLSEKGRLQVRASCRPERLAALGLTREATLVLSSDFRRARETAELLCELNGLAPPVIEPRLRERSFGELELGPSTGYETIWARDRVVLRERSLSHASIARSTLSRR
jgi:broad specificity phosphatase PhoE